MHEGLDADHCPARQVDHGLVVEDKLVAGNRVAQPHLALEALEGRRMEGGSEELTATAAARLGGVHGDVGVAQQLVADEGRACRRGRCRCLPRG